MAVTCTNLLSLVLNSYRAMAMVREVRPDYPSEYAAVEAVAKKLAIGTPETLRKWIRQAEIDSGSRQGVTQCHGV